METWMREYEKQLLQAVKKYPDEYRYRIEEVPEVARKMRIAFTTGTYNKDGRAFKATCEVFGIKHTYKEINEFIANHE